ncbi:MAG: amino acid adenylation domain-containing protein [Magnetococcales bacterium]|nr:amino acid adenylation domain-containing protein [Magnetococcales bacterium]
MLFSFQQGSGLPTRADRTYPLAANQRDLWLEQLSQAGSRHLIVGGYGYIHTVLDSGRLQQALVRLVQETDALRLIPASQGARVVQVYQSDILPKLEVKTFAKEEWEKARSWIIARFLSPFPLDGSPLYRFEIAQVETVGTLFSNKYHHVLIDGFSTSILLRRWADIYNALTENRPVQKKNPHTLSYLDYLESESNYRSGAAYIRDRNYWQGLLNRPLPTLFGGREVQPEPISTRSLTFLRPDYDRLAQWSQRYKGGTPYHLFLGLLGLLFLDGDQEEEMVIGIPVHHRSGRFRNTPGMLVDLNPLLLRWNPQQSFSDWIDEVIRQLRSSFRHKRFPVGEMAGLAGTTGENRRLFDIVLTHDKWDLSTHFQGVPSHSVRLFPGLATHALLVTILENHPNEAVQLCFDFNTGLFTEPEMQTLLRRAKHLLDQVMTHPDQPLQQLDRLPATERQQLLSVFNAPVSESDPPWQPVIRGFESQVRHNPDAIAIRWAGQTVTYGQLNQTVVTLADHLQTLGVGPEVAVGVYLSRSPTQIAALLAIFKAGGAYIPLDPEHPVERLRESTQNAAIPLIISCRDQAEQITEIGCPVLVLSLANNGLPDHLPQKKHRPIEPGPKPDGDSLAYVIHTSGTTGLPKGVMVGQRALAYRLEWLRGCFQPTDQDRFFQFFRLGFDPSAHEIFLPLTVGACLVLPPAGRQTPQALANLIIQEQVTVLSLVPTMAEAVLKASVNLHITSLRIVTSGGEALSVTLARQIKERWRCRLLNFYGPTEATILASCWEGDPTKEQQTIPLGRPIKQTQIHILDPQGNLLPTGKPGEIVIGGEGLARGYLNQTSMTNERFIADPFRSTPGARLYRTGDRGAWRSDGQLLFLGRLDRQIKLRGYRIELTEIEAVLLRHPSIKQAVVQFDQDTGSTQPDYLYAHLVGKPTHPPLKPEEIRQYLQNHLPDYMIPTAIDVIQQLPLTENGKIDPQRLSKLQRGNKEDHHQLVAPKTALENELMKLWQSHLCQMEISTDDDFFALGGDSLGALAIMAAVENRYAITLPLNTLFQQPTIADLGLLIESRLNKTAPPVSPARTKTGPACITLTPIRSDIKQNRPFFCIASALGDRKRLGRVARSLGQQQPFFLLLPPQNWPGSYEPPTVTGLAQAYADLIRQTQTGEEIHIGGYSIGGSVALAVGRVLHQQGWQVHSPILLDTIYPILIGLYLRVYRLVSTIIDKGGLYRFHWSRRFGDSGLMLHLMALKNEPEQSFPGSVILFQGTPMSGWSWRLFGRHKRYFSAGLESCFINGGHAGMTRGRYLNRLVEELRSILAKKQSGGSG